MSHNLLSLEINTKCNDAQMMLLLCFISGPQNGCHSAYRAGVENCQSGQKFLLTVGGGRRQVGWGQISLASNAKANGLNEAIPSQVWCTLLC